ncbi:hypothetical protein HZS_2309 [Henneguya salminicola]|nr:hypothetical protein HZS_2309 [Henneguya salminicola]
MGTPLRSWVDNLKIFPISSQPAKNCRIIKQGETVLVRMYGKGSKWEKGSVFKNLGERHYLVDVSGSKSTHTQAENVLWDSTNNPQMEQPEPSNAIPRPEDDESAMSNFDHSSDITWTPSDIFEEGNSLASES